MTLMCDLRTTTLWYPIKKSLWRKYWSTTCNVKTLWKNINVKWYVAKTHVKP